ncbi:MAG: haloacid dehalogenase [Paenibacillus sp.]|nr:haloacid dehalogenase [Paenibacillus sp.]
MSDIQAIVLDLDGTLLGSDKSISPRNYEAVRRCFDAGMPIIIATARPPRAANHFLRKFPFADYTVYYNGALVTCKSRQNERHISIPVEISQQIHTFVELRAPQSFISCEVNDSWYTCTPVPDSRSDQLGIRASDPKPQVVTQEYISSLSPTKILVVGCSTWREIDEQFGDHVNVIATDEGVLVQIMQKAASKEKAVQGVLDDIGVKSEQVMVFGDDFNDLGLFHMCGFPVAMGNAITELKNCAAHITASNDNDGVAVAIERFVLREALTAAKRSEAEHWNEVFSGLKLGEPRGDFWLEKFQPKLVSAPDGPVIDLGCGSGCDSLFLTERGYRVIACDFSSNALATIHTYIPGAETMLFDMTGGLPFPDRSAKAIVADLSLHYFHWEDTVSVVSEIARVVGTGGLLLTRLNSTRDVHYGAGQGVELEHHYYEQAGQRKRFFDRADLERLFAGWTIDALTETDMHRYGKPKVCWELAARVR